MSDTQQKKRKMSLTATEVTRVAPVSQLLIKRLSDKARLPTRGSELAAGYDLYRYVSNACFWMLDFLPEDPFFNHIKALRRRPSRRVERLW